MCIKVTWAKKRYLSLSYNNDNIDIGSFTCTPTLHSSTQENHIRKIDL